METSCAFENYEPRGVFSLPFTRVDAALARRCRPARAIQRIIRPFKAMEAGFEKAPGLFP
ncbi:MAG: hypothetical protein LBJ76_06180 [Candidatus Accumulibacter sp.]|jgi:hypothetical protein|nr:hypothetical protein [Accumulibacter sp.]